MNSCIRCNHFDFLPTSDIHGLSSLFNLIFLKIYAKLVVDASTSLRAINQKRFGSGVKIYSASDDFVRRLQHLWFASELCDVDRN